MKPGAGRKYVFFDSDYWRMSVQKAFLAPLGSPCSCSLWKEDSHSDFAMQVTNEKLIAIKHCQNGKDLYIWKTREPHDYLDCMAMCFAAAGSWGMSGAPLLKRRFLPKRPRVKII